MPSLPTPPPPPPLKAPAPSRCPKTTPPQKQSHVPSVPQAASQLANVLSGLHHTFVVADNTLPDCPLVYASEG